MDKTIIWTAKALEDLTHIYQFWCEKNGSNSCNQKLDRLFERHLKLLARFPKSGRKTEVPKLYLKVILNYLLFYKFDQTYLYVLTIRDARRNPETNLPNEK